MQRATDGKANLGDKKIETFRDIVKQKGVLCCCSFHFESLLVLVAYRSLCWPSWSRTPLSLYKKSGHKRPDRGRVGTRDIQAGNRDVRLKSGRVATLVFTQHWIKALHWYFITCCVSWHAWTHLLLLTPVDILIQVHSYDMMLQVRTAATSWCEQIQNFCESAFQWQRSVKDRVKVCRWFCYLSLFCD